MRSDQSRITEQPKFTYSTLWKASEKQTKTIKELQEKQAKAIEDNKKQLDNTEQLDNELLLSKERKIFKNIYKEKINKIDELSKKIDYHNLKYIVSNSSQITNFSEMKGPITLLDSIRKGEILVEKAKHKQEAIDGYLRKIRGRNKSEEQKKILDNINMLFKGRNNAIKFVDDYGSMILEAKKRAVEGLAAGEEFLNKIEKKKI